MSPKAHTPPFDEDVDAQPLDLTKARAKSRLALLPLETPSIQQEKLRPTLSKTQRRRAIAELPDAYLICHLKRHDFKDIDVEREGRNIYVQVSKCRRCTVECRKRYQKGYFLPPASYSGYPEGYHLDGFGHLNEHDRAALVARYHADPELIRLYNKEK